MAAGGEGFARRSGAAVSSFSPTCFSRSHRTGEIIKPAFTRFAFPPRWHYDVLRALDHFQVVGALARSATPRSRRARSPEPGEDRPWPLPKPYPGKTHFVLERGWGTQPVEHAPSSVGLEAGGDRIRPCGPL